jgi:hypothetical protein
VTAAFALTSERRWTIPEPLSADSLYRYQLGWVWDDSKPLVLFAGLNPSTFLPTKPDQTSRKWRGFASRGGFGGYIAINPFAFRAVNPRDLVDSMEAGIDIVGPENDRWIGEALLDPRVKLVVPCWGNPPSAALAPRLTWLRSKLSSFCGGPVPLMFFGFTNLGHPKHPLMLSWETELRA